MADEMGLGKTLQCIALLWTLLKQSPRPGKPTIEKCIIACPSSLVKNWANELGEQKYFLSNIPLLHVLYYDSQMAGSWYNNSPRCGWERDKSKPFGSCSALGSSARPQCNTTRYVFQMYHNIHFLNINLILSVMIVSYETLRTLTAYIANCEIGLLLCDEGHRLKNSGNNCSILSRGTIYTYL